MKNITISIAALFTLFFFQPSSGEIKPPGISTVDSFFTGAFDERNTAAINSPSGAVSCVPNIHPLSYLFPANAQPELDFLKAWGDNQMQAYSRSVAKCLWFMCGGVLADAAQQRSLEILDKAKQMLVEQQRFNEAAAEELNLYKSRLAKSRQECSKGSLTRMMAYDMCRVTTAITCSQN